MAPKQHTCLIAGGIALEHGACISLWQRCYVTKPSGRRVAWWYGLCEPADNGAPRGGVRVTRDSRGYNVFTWVNPGEER